MTTLSQDELNNVIFKTLQQWIVEEVQENGVENVSIEQRTEETIISFIEQLNEFLPYRNYAIEDKIKAQPIDYLSPLMEVIDDTSKGYFYANIYDLEEGEEATLWEPFEQLDDIAEIHDNLNDTIKTFIDCNKETILDYLNNK